MEGGCDVFLILFNSIVVMILVVECVCEMGKLVVVFDCGVNMDCFVMFIYLIGGFVWGIDMVEFLIDNFEEGDKVVVLCIFFGVDVLEYCWVGVEKLFEEVGIEVVDYFIGVDFMEIKSIISDEFVKGDVDGIWMDVGDGVVVVIEVFEDVGVDYFVMIGEDEMSFFCKWKDIGFMGFVFVYFNF